MLTAEEKEKIRAEEIFRAEVAKEIASAQHRAKSQRILVILNAPFTLWILSTVVIGLLGYTWSEWRSYQDNIKETNNRIRVLQLEITYRLNEFERHFNRSSDSNLVYATFPLRSQYTSGVWDDPQAIFPELAGRTLLSLLNELSLIIDQSKQGHAKDAVQTLNEIIAMAEKEGQLIDEGTPLLESERKELFEKTRESYKRLRESFALTE